jgi:hypothetical protein
MTLTNAELYKFYEENQSHIKSCLTMIRTWKVFPDKDSFIFSVDMKGKYCINGEYYRSVCESAGAPCFKESALFSPRTYSFLLWKP